MIKVVAKIFWAKEPTVRTMTIDENTTIRQVLENAGVDCSTGINAIDGVYCDLNKTFADYGAGEKCWLCHVPM